MMKNDYVAGRWLLQRFETVDWVLEGPYVM